MAKYTSILTIQGTIDDLTFRNTKEGKIVGKKTGPTREQVLQHEEFALTRCNAKEFRQAIKDARLLRHALGHVLDGVKCTTLNGHVNGLLHRLSRQDNIHEFGDRCASGGDVTEMTGFEFNKELSLPTAFRSCLQHSIDADAGTMRVQVPSFVAYKKKAFPREATHFRLVHGGAAINFNTGKYRPCIAYSDLLPLSRKTPGPIDFDCSLVVEPGEVLVQVLGIQLFRLENGEAVLVKGGAVQILDAAKAVTRINDELHELKSVEVVDAVQECSMVNDQCSIPNKRNMKEKRYLLKEMLSADDVFSKAADNNDGQDLTEALLPALVLCE